MNTGRSDAEEFERVYRNTIAFDNYNYNVLDYSGTGAYTHSNNSWDSDVVVEPDGSDFTGPLDSASIYDALIAARQADGSLPEITNFNLVTGSDLIDAGIDVGLSYEGTAPDIGPFEFPEGVVIEVTGITISASDKTLGNTSILGSNTTAVNRRAAPYTVTDTGYIESITMYHTGGGDDMYLAVYDDNSGSPNNQLGITAQTAVSASTGWQTIDLVDSVDVDSADVIWLAWVYENNPGIRYTNSATNRADAGEGWAGGMPDPFGASTLAGYEYSLYCTYKLTNDTVIRYNNGTLQLEAEVAPANASFQDVDWSSDDEDVATVNSSGLVTAVSSGTVTITATAQDGTGIYDTWDVIVSGQSANTLPTVTTTSGSDVQATTATSGGNVTDDGGASVTARGVCWSTSINPTTANSKTSDGTGTGEFTSYLTELIADTYYYIRAYATNSEGTAYGQNRVIYTGNYDVVNIGGKPLRLYVNGEWRTVILK